MDKYRELHKEDIPDLHNNELLKACKEDKDLLGEVLLKNSKFIFFIIDRYIHSIKDIKCTFSVSEDELLQQAFIGIMKALNQFDFEKGFKFTTFIYRPMVWEMNELLYNESQTVRLSRSGVTLLKRMSELKTENSCFPTPTEMASLLGVSENKIHEVLRFSNNLEDIDSFMDIASEDDTEKSALNKVDVEEIFAGVDLTEFELAVIELLKQDMLKSKIAEKLNVYPMAINRAIDKIRAKINRTYTMGRVSIYVEEIDIISEELVERGCLMSIEDIEELLDVCGYSGPYSNRTLYYIREKALRQSEIELDDCNCEEELA
ncbi:sigma-70 family RNA polymerase sigma factor [Bacillus pumilus]|uniref:sigma-70 family RNA polymerase sigma factor n=1 Tax=Bacillus TaxID=1386 RepID=UPI001C244B46|nr:sigma factor [Bacillus pumilus]MBU8576394.1 RNA polymerase subunit sigma [Bacillus pumilus]